MRLPRALVVLLVAVAAVAIVFLFVLPGRTYLAQRRTLSASAQRTQALAKANAALDQRVALLQTDAEVERIARERYQLIKPGETPYAILPPQQPAAPGAPPAATPKTSHRGLIGRLWRDLQLWR